MAKRPKSAPLARKAAPPTLAAAKTALPPQKVRKNIYLPRGLYRKVMEQAREFDFNFTGAVTIALSYYWLNPLVSTSHALSASTSLSAPAARNLSQPGKLKLKTRHRRDGDLGPTYTCDGVAVAWDTVRRVGEYMETHPDAWPTDIARILKIDEPTAARARDAWATEWYAEQLERIEAKG